MDTKEKPLKGGSTRTVHEIYLGGILLTTIAILLSVDWYKHDKLVELATFAATVSSLLLALIAIGYSIYSGTGVERSVATLVTAVQSIHSSAAEIDALTTELRAVASAADSIEKQLTVQSTALSRLSEQRAINAEAVATPTLPDAALPIAAESDKNESIFDDDKLDKFISVSSISGVLALLAVAGCKDKGAPVDYATPMAKTPVDPKYAHGFIVAFASAGLAEVTLDAKTIKRSAMSFRSLALT